MICLILWKNYQRNNDVWCVVLSSTGCEPYSEQACLEAVKNLPNPVQSLQKGDFATKGCYYYKEGQYSGEAYWGTGGTLAQRKNHPVKPGQFRPKGYDCKTGTSNQM